MAVPLVIPPQRGLRNQPVEKYRKTYPLQEVGPLVFTDLQRTGSLYPPKNIVVHSVYIIYVL